MQTFVIYSHNTAGSPLELVRRVKHMWNAWRYVHLVPEAPTRPYVDRYYTAAGDHYEICKPNGKNASSFVLLKDFLHEIQTDGGFRSQTSADFISNRGYFNDLEGRGRQVQSMLAQPDMHIIYITGLSGIGKTALAQQVFHEISHEFSITCFVSLGTVEGPSNPGEEVLRRIQHSLEAVNSGGFNQNILRGLGYLRRRKVLMVLDNVESEDQLRALQLETWLDGSGSKLIVTTTNSRLGTSDNTFEVPYLSYWESQKMLFHYAFREGDQPQGLWGVIWQVIAECEGLPLSLKILGGYMSKEDVNDKQLWVDLLDRLQRAQEVDSGYDHRLMAKLRLCYDALQPSEKEIFLDIACLFHCFPISKLDYIWRGYRESSHLAFSNLQRRFLAHVDEDGRIWMHRLLRNMGQSISNPSKTSVDKWKRISTASSVKELIAKHQGLVDAQAVELRIAKNEIIRLRNTTFVNFVNLEYLMLEGVRMSSGIVQLPTSLVYLRWKHGLFTSCPLDFSGLKNLAVLELVDCKSMKCLPPSVVNARKLLWLELQGCLSLTELPVGLSMVLEHLGFGKTSIKKLPSDIWNVKGLKHLHADKTQLTRVPEGLGRLEMLLSLDLSGTRVTTLPESLGGLTGLRDLNLCKTMLTSLPQSIGSLRDLRHLDLSWTYVKRLPESLGALVHLENLELGRSLVETLPDSLRQHRSLTLLDLQDTKIIELPDGMRDLVALKNLFLTGTRLRVWSETTSMLASLGELRFLFVTLCEDRVLSLESGQIGGQGEENALGLRDRESQLAFPAPLSQLPLLHAVSTLLLDGRGYRQVFLQPLFLALLRMPSLSRLVLTRFDLCETIPTELGLLTGLQMFELSNWKRLQELPLSVGELPMLSNLNLLRLPELCRLPESLRTLPALSEIIISRCESLTGRSDSVNQASPLDSDSSLSQGSQSGPSDILRPDFPGRRQLELVMSDSLEALEFFLGCCGKYTSRATYYMVDCNKMEKLLKRAAKSENGEGLVMDIKVAMEVISEIGLNFRGGDNDRLGVPRFCSSHTSRHHRHGSVWQNFYFRCEYWAQWVAIYGQCGIHDRVVDVIDTNQQEESVEFDERDNVMDLYEVIGEDTKIEESEGMVIKYVLRPLLVLGFSWFCISRMRRG